MIALYSRVSTEEQATNGYSILAQKNELEQYAKANNYEYVHYCDEGYSGGSLKRPALQKLLEDIKQNKINLVVFVKLDRWFRSVPDYYEIQKVLEEHNCNWRATQEDYETETSSGKFKVNIMLSVSQQFKDATSERIKSVFDFKMNNGYAVSPSVPFGFKTTRTENGLIIEVDNAELVKDFVDKTDEYASVEVGRQYINQKYALSLSYKQAYTLMHSPLIYGMFHEKQLFEPIVPKETVDRILNQMSRHNPKTSQYNQYIFKSLVVCPECGNKMIAYQNRSKCNGKVYKLSRYRCTNHYINKSCGYSLSIGENALERYLVSNFDKFTKEYIMEQENLLNEPKIDKKKIEQKLKRLNDMYLEDKCTKEYFDKNYIELKKQLDYEEPKIESFKRILEGNPMQIYNQLTIAEKNHFWRLLIKSIQRVGNDFFIEWL